MEVKQTERMDLLRQLSSITLEQQMGGASRERIAHFQRVVARLVQVQKMTNLANAVDVVCQTKTAPPPPPSLKPSPKPPTPLAPDGVTATPVVATTTTLQANHAAPAPVVRVSTAFIDLTQNNKKKARETMGVDGEMGESLSDDDDDEDDDDEDEVLLDANGKPLIVSDDDDVEYSSDDSLLDDDREEKFTDDEDESDDEDRKHKHKHKSKSKNKNKHKHKHNHKKTKVANKEKEKEKEEDDDDGNDDENAPKIRWMLEYRAMCEVRPGYELLVRRMDAKTAKLFETSDNLLKHLSVAIGRVVGNALNGELLVGIDRESAQRALQYITQLVTIARVDYVNLGKPIACAEMPGAITAKAIGGNVYKITLVTDGVAIDQPLTLYENQTWRTFFTFMHDALHLDRCVNDMFAARVNKCNASDNVYRRLPNTSYRERVAHLVNDSFVADIERYVSVVLKYLYTFIVKRNKDAHRMWYKDEELRATMCWLEKVEADGSRVALQTRATLMAAYDIESNDKTTDGANIESDSDSNQDQQQEPESDTEIKDADVIELEEEDEEVVANNNTGGGGGDDMDQISEDEEKNDKAINDDISDEKSIEEENDDDDVDAKRKSSHKHAREVSPLPPKKRIRRVRNSNDDDDEDSDNNPRKNSDLDDLEALLMD